MGTQDASSFTLQKRYTAQARPGQHSGQKVITHLYSYVPKASGLRDFLPTFSNKSVLPLKFTPINVTTLPQGKPRVPPRA